MGAGRVTAVDVARQAGVAVSTVSYILNDSPGQTFTAATKDRVRQAAKDLGYVPSAAARALRRGRSHNVLVLLPDMGIGESLAHVVDQLSDALERHGYAVVFRRSRAGRSATSLAAELAPAAVVSLVPVTDDEVAGLGAAGVPLVRALGGDDGVTDRDLVQQAIGRAQAQHLLDLGHRHLAYAASDDARVEPLAGRRLAGVREVVDAAGAGDLVVAPVPLDAAAAADVVAGWLRSPTPPTAVCAYNDVVALAVLAGMRRQGVGCPDGLAVVGVDDVVAARLGDPPLTTVDFHLDALTSELAEAVLDRVLGRGDGRQAVWPGVELVRRAST